MSAPAIKVAEQLGGAPVLHRRVRSELDLMRTLRDGIPAAAVEQFVTRGSLTRDEVYSLIIPRRTLMLRKQKHQPLTAEESEKAARVARTLASAEATFGDTEKARAWLRRPSRGLGGVVPLALLDTEAGGRIVEEELLRIAGGVY